MLLLVYLLTASIFKKNQYELSQCLGQSESQDFAAVIITNTSNVVLKQ